MSHSLRVPARRRRTGRPNPPDYIETKQIYHPETGELLGVLAAEGIPTDPKKLPAFVKRKAKAAAPRNAISILSGNGDGWDQLRNHDFWPNLRDHRFWKKLQTEFKRLPYGVSADATGLCDSGKSIATSSLGRQLARDAFTRLAWRAIDKLREFGLASTSDPVEIWLELAKSNPEFTRIIVSSTIDRNGSLQATMTSYVECGRTASVALCSTLATQALKNDIRADPRRLALPKRAGAGQRVSRKRKTPRSAQKWEEVEISFLSDERIQVWIDGQPQTYNYAEFGCSDQRNDRPNKVWAKLQELASTGGVIADRDRISNKRWPATEKLLERLRKLLKSHFHLGEDPLPFQRGTGYQLRCKIGNAASFDK